MVERDRCATEGRNAHRVRAPVLPARSASLWAKVPTDGRPSLSAVLRDLSVSQAALVVGCATLLVASTTLALNIRWRRQAPRAKLIAESHTLYENPNAPAGWQVRVQVRNTGGAPANGPAIWVTERESDAEPPDFRDGVLAPGEGVRMLRDLPREPGDRKMRVMLCWDDHGTHKRKSGIRI
jgi:hypothetical protein